MVQRLRGGHVPAATIKRRCLPGRGRILLQSTHKADIPAGDALGVPPANGVEARRVVVGKAVAVASGTGATTWPSSRVKSAARRAKSRPRHAPSSGMMVCTATHVSRSTVAAAAASVKVEGPGAADDDEAAAIAEGNIMSGQTHWAKYKSDGQEHALGE